MKRVAIHCIHTKELTCTHTHTLTRVYVVPSREMIPIRYHSNVFISNNRALSAKLSVGMVRKNSGWLSNATSVEPYPIYARERAQSPWYEDTLRCTKLCSGGAPLIKPLNKGHLAIEVTLRCTKLYSGGAPLIKPLNSGHLAIEDTFRCTLLQ